MSQTASATSRRKSTTAAKKATKATKTAVKSTAKTTSKAAAKTPQGKKSMPAAAMGQDAITMLKDDHKVVEKLFREFEKAGDSAYAKKRRIVDQVIAELTTHAYIEESLFYPTARKAAPETGEHVLESVEEHHVVAWMLNELKSADPRDERFDAKMTVLMENVRHHVKEEEQEWFPEVRKAMSRADLKELGAKMQAAKSKAPSNPLSLSSAKA
ncbi:hemerythrin domain-containing protein [Catellatospora coxensis]|uniref:Hemerythrin n=1 Tax=Catellatospora coxensis TaxID=310354 RepID=A0A8J3KXR7_9ACTN|nr:hemerythrin domain-containing protein [Catellatospora coxensis]GIG05016.1 hemerythrin [Catellatospora coxensis]